MKKGSLTIYLSNTMSCASMVVFSKHDSLSNITTDYDIGLKGQTHKRLV